MKTLWLGVLCLVVSVMAIWCARTTYGEPPKAPEDFKMIALDDAILDANQILFVEQTQSEIRIGFRGLPSQGNGAYSVVFVRKTADNWRKLAAATGVAVPPRAPTAP
jgi:hypothetical protein